MAQYIEVISYLTSTKSNHEINALLAKISKYIRKTTGNNLKVSI